MLNAHHLGLRQPFEVWFPSDSFLLQRGLNLMYDPCFYLRVSSNYRWAVGVFQIVQWLNNNCALENKNIEIKNLTEKLDLTPQPLKLVRKLGRSWISNKPLYTNISYNKNIIISRIVLNWYFCYIYIMYFISEFPKGK